ncbi:MAG: hypothetical protein GF330_12010 [Candidatus Eisenbacteria bacterium]|nr:hypothetical protein [Candidatus Eisenbacteria bacterium]
MKGFLPKRWMRRLSGAAALAGGFLTSCAALGLGLPLPTAVARGLVVGALVYMLLALGARILAPRPPDAPANAKSSTRQQRPTGA